MIVTLEIGRNLAEVLIYIPYLIAATTFIKSIPLIQRILATFLGILKVDNKIINLILPGIEHTKVFKEKK